MTRIKYILVLPAFILFTALLSSCATPTQSRDSQTDTALTESKVPSGVKEVYGKAEEAQTGFPQEPKANP